jgi:hypothetical protein
MTSRERTSATLEEELTAVPVLLIVRDPDLGFATVRKRPRPKSGGDGSTFGMVSPHVAI